MSNTNILYDKQWLEITKGFNFCYKVSQYHDRYSLIISLIYLTFYFSLPNLGYDFNKWDRSWGISYHGRSVWFNWGEKSKSVYMPWSWEHVRFEVMFPDGSMRDASGTHGDTSDGRLVEIHPYRYVLKSGEIQNRQATVYVEEREWRWQWFKWLPYPRMISRCISVEFDGEVGEGAGSWKGGTIGCGYEMLPNETMGETLKRMESERKFGR